MYEPHRNGLSLHVEGLLLILGRFRLPLTPDEPACHCRRNAANNPFSHLVAQLLISYDAFIAVQMNSDPNRRC